MSLYDRMNKKPVPVFKEAPSPVVEAPVAEPESDENAAKAAAEPVQTAPAQPVYKYTSWWETPNFVAAQEKLAEEGEKRMELEEWRAKRDRDAAILGDIARLASQAYAKSGGAWKIDKTTPQTAEANERLRVLREKNAAQLEAYRKGLMAARQAEAADRQKRNVVEGEMAQKDKHSAKELALKAADIEAKNNYNAAKLAQDKEYKDAMLDLKKLGYGSIDAYRKGLLEIKANPATMTRKANGDYTISLYGNEMLTFPRQFYEDNEPLILGKVLKDWRNGLESLAKFKNQVGDLKNPSEDELRMMVQDSESAIQEILRLHSVLAKNGASQKMGEKKGSNGLGWGNKNKNNKTDW